MTKEIAIEILEERWRYSRTYKYTDAEIREAFELAIKALEQQPCEDAITKRPTARWERLVDDFKKCSKCGRPVKLYRNYKHCPECGAKMEEVEE